MPKDTSKHQHGLTKQQIKAIPEKLKDPVMVMDALDPARNSIVVVADMLDPDNLPVIVAIKADGKGMYNNVEIVTNFVTSYYGRESFANFISANVKANMFLYINSKKATALAAGPGTQWLGQLKNYSFDTIIRKTHANVNRNNTDETYAAVIATGDMGTAQEMASTRAAKTTVPVEKKTPPTPAV